MTRTLGSRALLPMNSAETAATTGVAEMVRFASSIAAASVEEVSRRRTRCKSTLFRGTSATLASRKTARAGSVLMTRLAVNGTGSFREWGPEKRTSAGRPALLLTPRPVTAAKRRSQFLQKVAASNVGASQADLRHSCSRRGLFQKPVRPFYPFYDHL